MFLLIVLTVLLECCTTIFRYELICNCWNTSPRQRPIFADISVVCDYCVVFLLVALAALLECFTMIWEQQGRLAETDMC